MRIVKAIIQLLLHILNHASFVNLPDAKSRDGNIMGDLPPFRHQRQAIIDLLFNELASLASLCVGTFEVSDNEINLWNNFQIVYSLRPLT